MFRVMSRVFPFSDCRSGAVRPGVQVHRQLGRRIQKDTKESKILKFETHCPVVQVYRQLLRQNTIGVSVLSF